VETDARCGDRRFGVGGLLGRRCRVPKTVVSRYVSRATGIWADRAGRPAPATRVAGWALSHAFAAEISAVDRFASDRLRTAARASGSRLRRIRQAVTNAKALVRLLSPSCEALSSYAAQTSASVELLAQRPMLLNMTDMPNAG